MNFIKPYKNGVSLDVFISPKSSKNIVKGIRENRLWISINAQPHDGKANEELIYFLGKLFNITKSNIEIISGHRGKNKRIYLKDCSYNDIQKILKI